MDTRGIKELAKDGAKYIGITIIVLILFIYIVSFQQVIGPSMEPNYIEGDIYVLNKIKYKIFDPKRFEVVVVDSKDSKYMIKRIIGLPGDTLEYKDNELYINGEKIKEDFKRTGSTEDFTLEKFESLTIPENNYFVLGDNRENSKDSRTFGFVSKNKIVGKVEFRIWPLVKK